MNQVTVRNTCRVCDGPPLESVLDLGSIYISDFPTTPDGHDHPAVPLHLMRCPKCTLVQLRHTTPAAWMFHAYWYRSSVNESMVAALGDIVTKARELVPVGKGDLVVDIGANDGTLLSWYQRTGECPTRIAYEPATNLYDALRSHAEVVVSDFFKTGAYHHGPKAKIVSSAAMFYDLDDPNTFVADVTKILADDGVWVIQMAYLPAMLRQTAFDNVCHEHLEYYTLFSLERLLERHDLIVADVEENDVNGGSFRVYVRHVAWWRQQPTTLDADARVAAMLALEETDGYLTVEPFRDFAWRVEEVRKHVLAAIAKVRADGGVVDIYGASTKGNTLTQGWGIDHTLIRRAIERSPEKVGRYMVGTGIPIVSEEEGRRDPAALWLCLPWHFRASFLQRESEYLAGGGCLLFPLPHAELVVAAAVKAGV